MTQALTKALAETNDPLVVKQLLETKKPVSLAKSNNSTLSKQYERFLLRRRDRSPYTISQYKRTIPVFIEYAEKNDVATPNQVSINLVESYVDKLFDKYEPDATILTHTKNLRAWLSWLNKRDLCIESVFEILDKGELGLDPKARDEALPESEAIHIIRQLRNQRRWTSMHALTELIWNAGPRIGGVHSLDVTDFDPENHELEFRHCPNEDTRLKNGYNGERIVILQSKVADAIHYYIENDRPDSTDEYGREPLFATSSGRPSKSTLRRWIYNSTSCRWAKEGPNQASCDGSCDPDSNVCSFSYYPHAIRRGAIVNHLSNGLRPDRASERFDVSVKVIEKHYDPRLKRQRKEDRAEAVRKSWSSF